MRDMTFGGREEANDSGDYSSVVSVIDIPESLEIVVVNFNDAEEDENKGNEEPGVRDVAVRDDS